MFRIAHISDLHLSRLPPLTLAQLANKRLLGYLSWRLRRHRQHLATVLDALVRDLHAVDPNHIAITGDLVNLALPAEFAEAGAWLRRLGSPEAVSVVPGNHDALVHVLPGDGWDHWRAYACSDPDTPDAADGFPYLRRRGPLAIVGLSTAFPSLPGHATGRLGAIQLARLDRLLERLSGAGQCRVLLMHHSPVEGVSRRRRRLLDAPELRRCLAERGADLVLHGHEHRFRFDQIAGASGPVPVFGVPSASKHSVSAAEVAQYYVYEIEGSRGQWRIVAESRRFAAASHGFVPGTRQIVARQDDTLALVPESGGGRCRRSA
ncbi:MAG: metallophosphoesterase family protein [Geminicoccaceae bacterium]